jgi:hypothetical protein
MKLHDQVLLEAFSQAQNLLIFYELWIKCTSCGISWNGISIRKHHLGE